MDYIEIDGSAGEGGGQILRTSMSLAAIFSKNLRISNIRARRKEPGLRPQHLQAVLAVAGACEGKLSGASVGSTSLEFVPGKLPERFSKRIDTGTAGSIVLIAQTLIPVSMFGGIQLDVEIVGGTEVSNSPSIDYLTRVVLPSYRKLGADVQVELIRRGYYPRGGGLIRLRCKPTKTNTINLVQVERPKSEEIEILSVSRMLPDHVSRRQLDSAKRILEGSGFFRVRGALDFSGTSLSPGSSLLIHSVTESRFIGASSLGEKGKRSEAVGEEAARLFLEEISFSPSVDSHLADMLVTILPCIEGESAFTTSRVTEHLKTNIEIAKKISGSKFELRSENGESGRCVSVTVTGISEKSN